MEKINRPFCKYCGRKMDYMGLKGAEKFSWIYGVRTNEKYDSKTGKRQMMMSFRCKNSTRLFSKHDSYATGKIILQ